jgi:hypothetical protein
MKKVKNTVKNKKIKHFKIKKEIAIASILLVSFIVILLLQYVLLDKKYTHNLAMVVSKMTEVKDGLNWSQMGEQEKISKYRQMMIKIMTVYGFQYDSNFKKAMNKDEKIKYINLNYEAATKLNMDLFDVPTIHLMETAFNPYAKGDYSEIGIGQIKYETGLMAEKLLQFMPRSKRKILDFDLKSKEDLHDPLISTKAAYVLLWYLKREFQGREDWYISAYHWGGFLSRRWDNGEGDVPSKFTLNGIDYNVIKYYVTFKELKESFKLGKLEAGKAIEEKWVRYQKKLVQEEIDFRRTKKIIRNLRKQLVEKRKIQENLDKKNEEINMALNNANTELIQISDGAQKDGKLSLRKVKGVVKNLLKKINKIN